MFKFLRKYNKWILAVGGTLLMVVFLVPQAIQSLSQRAAVGSAVWATVGADDEEVSASDRVRCTRELDVLEQIGRAGVPLAITDDPEHWYLLCREAEQAGLLGGRAGDQMSPEMLGSLASLVGSSRTLDQAISKSFAIGRMIDLYQRAGKLSDNRLHTEAERLFHTAEGRTIVLQAEPDDTPAEPTEAEMLAQFEMYRDLAPGGPDANRDPENPDVEPDFPEENLAGFGYKLPDRFKIEWLRVERDAVRDLIEAGDDLNDIALIKHWQRNQQAKAFPEVDPNAETVPERVRTDLLDELVTAKLDAVRKFIGDRMLASWRRLKAPEGYYEVPDDWSAQRIAFPELAQELQAEFPGLALPSYEAIGDRWLTVADVADLEGLAGANTDKYASGVTNIESLIEAILEFGGNPTILVQEGIAGPILADRVDNSLVVFRITDTDPTRPARDIDEVRERVVEDLRRQAAYDALVAEMTGLEERARNEGLLALSMAKEADLQRLSVSLYSPAMAQFQIQNNMPLRPFPNSLPVIGQDEAASRAIIDHALSLPSDKPLTELDRSQRVFAVPVPEKLAVLIVELEGQRPLDRARFDQLVGTKALQSMLVSRELLDSKPSLSDVFKYEVMKERHNFNVQVREGDGDPDAETDEAAPTETASAQ